MTLSESLAAKKHAIVLTSHKACRAEGVAHRQLVRWRTHRILTREALIRKNSRSCDHFLPARHSNRCYDFRTRSMARHLRCSVSNLTPPEAKSLYSKLKTCLDWQTGCCQAQAPSPSIIVLVWRNPVSVIEFSSVQANIQELNYPQVQHSGSVNQKARRRCAQLLCAASPLTGLLGLLWRQLKMMICSDVEENTTSDL